MNDTPCSLVAVRYLALESVNLIRKYWGFIDSLFSFNHFICTADWSTRKQIQVNE